MGPCIRLHLERLPPQSCKHRQLSLIFQVVLRDEEVDDKDKEKDKDNDKDEKDEALVVTWHGTRNWFSVAHNSIVVSPDDSAVAT